MCSTQITHGSPFIFQSTKKIPNFCILITKTLPMSQTTLIFLDHMIIMWFVKNIFSKTPHLHNYIQTLYVFQTLHSIPLCCFRSGLSICTIIVSESIDSAPQIFTNHQQIWAQTMKIFKAFIPGQRDLSLSLPNRSLPLISLLFLIFPNHTANTNTPLPSLFFFTSSLPN